MKILDENFRKFSKCTTYFLVLFKHRRAGVAQSKLEKIYGLGEQETNGSVSVRSERFFCFPKPSDLIQPPVQWAPELK
jgi:hypothetical protein